MTLWNQPFESTAETTSAVNAVNISITREKMHADVTGEALTHNSIHKCETCCMGLNRNKGATHGKS